VGLGLGAGVGAGLGEGAGVGDGVGWGAAELVVPAHPPNNKAETTANKIRAAKPILDVKRMVPSKAKLEGTGGATLLAPGGDLFTC
jgi:hypothetical protein